MKFLTMNIVDVFQATGELPFEPEFASVYADFQLIVEGHKFYCHKV